MNNRRAIFGIGLFCAGLLLVAAPANAQGKLRGTATDADGNPLAGVDVHMVPLGDELPTVKTKSNKKGKFVFGILRKAEYRLIAFSPGMRISRVDANLAVPSDDSLWAYHEDTPPGTEMPHFSVTGVTEVTVDLKFEPHADDPGQYGTGKPISPTKLIIDLIQEGKIAEAGVEIDRYLEFNPDNATLYYFKAFYLRAEARPDDALSAVDKCIELDPGLEGARLLKGKILEDVGQLEPAVAEYREEAETAMAIETRRDSYLGAAAVLIKLERNGEAIEMLEKLLTIAPDHAGAYKELADLYTREGNQEKAGAMLEKVTALGEADPNILFNMGAERFNAGDFAGARELFEKTIAADPEYADAHLQLAYTSLNTGDMEGAAASLEKFIELSPEDSNDVQTARALLQQIKKQ